MADTYDELDEWAKTEIDEVLDNLVGQSYEDAIQDNSGCYFGPGRGNNWVSPKLIAEALSDLTCRLSED